MKDWKYMSDKEKNKEMKKMGFKMRYPFDFTCPPTRSIMWIGGRYKLVGEFTAKEILELEKEQEIELKKIEESRNSFLEKRIKYLGY